MIQQQDGKYEMMLEDRICKSSITEKEDVS
jgi:hypothetical protein